MDIKLDFYLVIFQNMEILWRRVLQLCLHLTYLWFYDSIWSSDAISYQLGLNHLNHGNNFLVINGKVLRTINQGEISEVLVIYWYKRYKTKS